MLICCSRNILILLTFNIITVFLLNICCIGEHKIYLQKKKKYIYKRFFPLVLRVMTLFLNILAWDVLTSMSTRTLEMNMNIILRASSSSNERARQPFSLHSSTADAQVKDSTHNTQTTAQCRTEQRGYIVQPSWTSDEWRAARRNQQTDQSEEKRKK